MSSSLSPLIYGLVLFIVLWQAFRVMRKGFSVRHSSDSFSGLEDSKHASEDRTGRLTIHPELLDNNGRITDEDLLTVRFSEDLDPPQSAETSAE